MPFAACILIGTGGCSEPIPEDLLDRARILEVADAEEQDSLIPEGVGGFRLKKEMFRDGGWMEEDGRFLFLFPEDLTEAAEHVVRLQALVAWADEQPDMPVRVWVDGQAIPADFVHGDPGKVVSARDFARILVFGDSPGPAPRTDAEEVRWDER